jgi:hypothetical protein
LLDLIDFALVALLWSVDSFAWHDPCFKEWLEATNDLLALRLKLLHFVIRDITLIRGPTSFSNICIFPLSLVVVGLLIRSLVPLENWFIFLLFNLGLIRDFTCLVGSGLACYNRRGMLTSRSYSGRGFLLHIDLVLLRLDQILSVIAFLTGSNLLSNHDYFCVYLTWIFLMRDSLCSILVVKEIKEIYRSLRSPRCRIAEVTLTELGLFEMAVQ